LSATVYAVKLVIYGSLQNGI